MVKLRFVAIIISIFSILIAMAKLQETLGTYKAPKYSYNYSPPRISSPYPQYPSYKPQTPDQNPNIYAGLAARESAQTMRPQPSTNFQAEYNYDPVLARISQMGQMAVADARSEASALKKRAFIEAGDADITRELGADQNTIDAAAANPFSTKKLLEKDFTERGQDLDQYENQNNLFYSGHRADQLTELERGRTKAYTDWSQVLRDLLSNIDTGVLNAEENARRAALARVPVTRSAPASTGGPPPPGATFPDGTPDYSPTPAVGGGLAYPVDYLDYPPVFSDEDRLRAGREQRLLASLGLA